LTENLLDGWLGRFDPNRSRHSHDGRFANDGRLVIPAVGLALVSKDRHEHCVVLPDGADASVRDERRHSKVIPRLPVPRMTPCGPPGAGGDAGRSGTVPPGVRAAYFRSQNCRPASIGDDFVKAVWQI
jgi:hypothetical protein